MSAKDLLPFSRGRSGGAVDPFRRMQEEMSDMLSRIGGGLPSESGFGLAAGDGIAMPDVDIAETQNAYEVTLDVPGVAASDMDVSVDNGVLTVSGQRESETKEGGEDRSFHRVERYRGRFVRRIALPAGIDEDAVEARHENGVLTVRLPKVPEAQKKQKRVEIRTG
jgi:HSP20 family protein